MPRLRAKNSVKDEEVGDFYRSLPEVDECRYLIQKIIEQAVRDFIALEKSTSATEHYSYETACGFLFDDNYRVNWGGEEKSFQDLLDFIDLDAAWVRKKTLESREKKLKRISFKKVLSAK